MGNSVAVNQTRSKLKTLQRVVDAQVQRRVEKHVVKHIRRMCHRVQVESKKYFIQSISNTSLASAFHLDTNNIHRVLIEKRQYAVYDCGPELRNVPRLEEAIPPFVLDDPDIILFLLHQCTWTEWHPSAAWRMQIDQIYNVTFESKEHPLLIRLRVGRKWIGAHHDNEYLAPEYKDKWLHRTDYERKEDESVVSSFFETIDTAWQEYMDLRASLQPIDVNVSDMSRVPIDYNNVVDQRISLRIQYFLQTSWQEILADSTSVFRHPNQFEQWRMEQEDLETNRSVYRHAFAGPLVDAPIDELISLYETQDMEKEDENILI